MNRFILRLAATALAGFCLTACAAKERLSYVGQPPPLSAMQNEAAMRGSAGFDPRLQRNPQAEQIAQLQAVAAAHQASAGMNSLWRSNSHTFFGDPRAARVGDILTVNIDISDRAQVSNQTSRARTSAEDSDLTNFLGGEAALSQFFNDAIDPSSLTSFGSTSSTQGSGSVNRSETISMTAAAIVVEVLWNGNMVIHGRQEVRINNEVRELLIAGIVRPQDIDAANTIDHTQIAEARISYGGRGHISEMQRPPIGQEIYNLLWPF
ncbi:MAG: flagellar basal body L-ring protein FlgH [Pseudomonadota bacterium]